MVGTAGHRAGASESFASTGIPKPSPLAPIFEPLTAAHVRLARPRADDRVLDLASGSGIVGRHLAAAGVGSIVGADPNRVRMRGGDPSAEERGRVAARAEALPFAGDSFTLVACQHGVMFFSDVAAAFREIARVLRPSGRVTVTAWCAAERSAGLHSLNRALSDEVGAEAQRNSAVPFSMPDPDQVRTPLVEAGFEAVTHHPIDVDVAYASAREFVLSFIEATSLAPVVARAGPDAAARVADRVEQDFGRDGEPFRFVARAYCVAATRAAA